MSIITSGKHGQAASGYTVAELAIILAVVGVMASMAIPASDQMFTNQRLRDSADTVQQAFSYAREEAIKTGNIFIVFAGTDASGNDLLDANGNPVDVVILDDGRPGSGNQNCKIDGGEATMALSLEDDIRFGSSTAGVNVNSDGGAGDRTTGSTFTDADGNQAGWVLFRPEGTPISFSTDCSMGEVGDGAGAIYVTSGERDSAVVVTPLGATRVHAYRNDNGAWSS